jgi:hypothetical protein
MKEITIDEMIKTLHGNATSKQWALQRLILSGHGDCSCAEYVGTPYATHKTSNAYKFRSAVEKSGKKVVAEAAGAKTRDGKSQFIVYCAIK